MQVIDLLSERDLSIIRRYMHSYGGYGGDELMDLDNTEHLLRFWNDAKSGFLSTLMGDQLILEREISISVPESILGETMENVLYPNGDGIDFINNFYTWANKLKYNEYEMVNQLLDIEYLITNVYDGDSFELSVAGRNHTLQINKGCKVMKILGKIAQAFNIDDFEDFRLKHSMVLNQKNFKGTLCLSIHPLDYMTMSDNECDWDSCMSWRKPGEYREGTVEMMNSPYVIVAYLKAEEDMNLFPWDDPTDLTEWNNKRWRKLYVVTPDLMSGIKGYPYNDRTLEAEVFKWLLELVKTNCPWCHYDAPIEYEAGETFEYRSNKMQVWYNFKIMYNDFYGKHIGYFSPTILKKLDKNDIYHLMVSGATMCLECGEAYDDIKNWDTQSLLCPSCTGQIKCYECEDFTSIEDCYEVDGKYLCPYCAETYTNKCDFCEELHYRDNTTPIYLMHNNDILLDENFFLCEDCLNEENHENLNRYYGEIIERPHPRRAWYGSVQVLSSDNMTLQGFRAFGYFGRTIEEARSHLN